MPLPQVLVTADDIARTKPHPDGYLAQASRLDVPPSACAVIEDAPPASRPDTQPACPSSPSRASASHTTSAWTICAP
jgi:sugar-phosphatase